MAIAPVLERESSDGEDGEEYEGEGSLRRFKRRDYPDENGVDGLDDFDEGSGSIEPEVVEIQEDDDIN